MKPKRKLKQAKSKRTQTGVKSGDGKCACGCGAEVSPGRRFKQGHDARMRPNSEWRKQHPELGR